VPAISEKCRKIPENSCNRAWLKQAIPTRRLESYKQDGATERKLTPYPLFPKKITRQTAASAFPAPPKDTQTPCRTLLAVSAFPAPRLSNTAYFGLLSRIQIIEQKKLDMTGIAPISGTAATGENVVLVGSKKMWNEPGPNTPSPTND
ncbi:MAG: hypothetical protein KDB22_30585, partial [Planctomycetales bacterium]|nr:hypothetical protein [Planctomycetales bacterium]